MNPREIRQIGRYPVRRFIAEGGMAWVFEVVEPTFQASRALKMLKSSVGGPDLFRRFQDEARILARLDHPNLLTIYDFGLDEATGCHYYTMPLVDTPPLAERGPIPVDEAVEIALGALSGLAKLHESNIIHRDIKPSNILIHPDGRAMLADLGIARSADLSEGETWYTASPSSGTSTGMAIGTPAYMSPEQARGRRDIGKPTDVFSLGLTLYRILTGLTVYEGVEEIDSGSGQDILAYLGHLSIGGSEFDFEFGPEIPEPIQEVIRTACRMDPAERYPDAAALRDALRAAQRGERPRAPRSDTRPERRPPLWIAAVAALALVGVALGWWFLRGTTPVTTTRAEVAKLDKSSAQLLERAQAQGAPNAVLDSARGKRATAVTLVGLGEQAEERKDANKAQTYLDDAQQGFEAACEILATQFFEGVYAREVESVQQRATRLRAAGADVVQPESWGRLQAGLAALGKPEPGGSPCAAADAYQAKLADAHALADGARALEKAVEAEAPRLVEQAREQARGAELEATAGAVEASEFDAAIVRARGSVQEGETAYAGRSYLAARDAFSAATGAFKEASAIALAVRARQEASRLLTEAKAAGRSDAAVDRKLAEADQLYANKSWPAAVGAYGEAGKWLKIGIDRERETAPAKSAHDVAEQAREQAWHGGAEKSAGAEFAAADEQLSAASRAFEAGHFGEAKQGYDDANLAFESARRKAEVELDLARAAGGNVRAAQSSLGKDCAQLVAVARGDCKSASEELAHGDAAIASADAPTALASFASAQQALDRARLALERFEPARAARTAAEQAREQARRGPAEKSAAAELAAAEEQLTAATRAFEAGRFDDAKQGYTDAKQAFEGAGGKATGALQLAREAGSKARAAQSSLGKDCAQLAAIARGDCKSASDALARGDAAVASGDAPGAIASFESAQQALDRARAALEGVEPALAARTAAEQAREQARRGPAEKSAAAELAAAEEQLTAATRAFEAGRFDDAKQGYTAAKLAFEGVGGKATGALQLAREAGSKARAAQSSLGKDCAQLAAIARADCKSASDALARGDAAVASGDAPGAIASFASAQQALDRASAALEGFEKDSPRAPEIVSRSPKQERIAARRGDKLRFEVSARDANPDDALRYLWSVDGRERPETGPVLELGAERAEAVEVRVEDPGGLRANARWQVGVENRSPALSLSPAQTELNVEVGRSLLFEAKSSDPDGEPVKVAFLIDGKPVQQQGDRFTFQAEKAGTFQLEARATDAAGAVTAVKRRIRVQAVEVAKAPPPRLRSQSPAGAVVKALPSESVRLSVDVEQPDGAPLRYRWTVAGRPANASGPSLDLPAERSGDVRVQVTNESGGSVEARWRLEVESQKPQLTLEPREAKLAVEVGKKITFNAAARAPDGADVSIAYLLDGKPVANTPVYEFEAVTSGVHKLEVRAGEGNAVARAERLIDVTEEPKPIVVVSPPPPVAPAFDPRQVADTALKEYRAAYESRDIDRLSSIWDMDGAQRSNMANFFKSTSKLSIDVETRSAQEKDDQVSVEFDQTITAQGIKPSRASLVATLVKSGPRWKIRRIGPR